MRAVFALWACPSALPCVVTHAAVSKRVLEGADLFWPGVTACTPSNTISSPSVNCKVSVRVAGNPCPFAIGLFTPGSPGCPGTAVTVLHAFRDQLWEMGGRRVPNEGFLQYRVLALPGSADAADAETDSSDDGESSHAKAAEPAAVSAPVEAASQPAVSSRHDILDCETDDMATITSSLAGACIGDDVIVDAEPAAAALADEASSADDILITAFLEALKTRVKSSDLPMFANVLFANFVLPCRTAGSTIAVKATSFKSFSGFLKAWQ